MASSATATVSQPRSVSIAGSRRCSFADNLPVDAHRIGEHVYTCVPVALGDRANPDGTADDDPHVARQSD